MGHLGGNGNLSNNLAYYGGINRCPKIGCPSLHLMTGHSLDIAIDSSRTANSTVLLYDCSLSISPAY